MKITDIIIQETDDFVALNKPSGLLSIPDREGKEVSLKKLLIEAYGNIYTVHRLDKDTSGVIIFAKHEAAHKFLSQQFEEHKTQKIYCGLVIGTPPDAEGTIESPIMEHPVKKGLMVINRKGKPSVTDYKLLENFGAYSWMQFQIHTGRTHQIRIHMKELGHPIICDELYGDGKPVLLSSIKSKFKLSKSQEEETPLLKRLALHSWKLKITDMNGKVYELEAPIPKDLRATISQLEKNKKGAEKRFH